MDAFYPMAGCSENMHEWCNHWRLTNFSIPWNFKYWLAYLWCTLLTEHEVTNKITFSAVRAVNDLLLPGRLSTRVSKLFSFLQRHSSFQLFQPLLCSMSKLSRYKCLIKIRYFLNGMLTNSSDVWKASFWLPWKIAKESKYKHDVWCEIINAVRQAKRSAASTRDDTAASDVNLNFKCPVCSRRCAGRISLITGFVQILEKSGSHEI